MEWLREFFRKESCSEISPKKGILRKATNRLHAMCRIRKVALDHLKSLLESYKHPSAERVLICQLLIDLETSFDTFASDSETAYHQQNQLFAAHQRDLAALLCKTGDSNGALSLLHRIPLSQLGEKDLDRIMQLGAALCSRMKAVPKILGIGDDPIILDVSLDVLVLPYSLLAVHSRQWIDNEGFIKKSFMWPWIRRSIQSQMRDNPGEPVDWSPTRLDTRFRDAFGHSFLHAAIYSQYNDYITDIVKEFDFDQEDVRAYLSTACPSYAQGFAPLACSASSLTDWEIFRAFLSFSGKDLCCGSSGIVPGHTFCALAFAIHNRDNAVVKALVQRSIQQKVNISECCKWAFRFIPDIPPEIRDYLVETLQQSMASGEEDVEEALRGQEA